jgi:hypothetical protein
MNATLIFAGFAALAFGTLASTPAAGAPAPSGSTGKSKVVTLEPIPGTTVKRITLIPKAAERLGIEIGKVSEQAVVRKQLVGGLVIPAFKAQPEPKPSIDRFAGFTQAAGPTGAQEQTVELGGFERVAAKAPVQPGAMPQTPAVPGQAWVLVTLSPAEWERIAKDKPARILPLATREGAPQEILARPSGMQPVEDSKRSMLKLFYIVADADHRLDLNKRMRVELPLSGTDQVHRVVPYSAVYYDAKGAAWVYVNTKPLTYERQRIDIDHIAGDVAVLSNGPAVGTPIVTVGAGMLFGTEVFGK